MRWFLFHGEATFSTTLLPRAVQTCQRAVFTLVVFFAKWDAAALSATSRGRDVTGAKQQLDSYEPTAALPMIA